MDGLEGRYRVERTGGLLPPMPGVTKRAAGSGGSTRVFEVVGWPFRLERGGDGLRLVYRAPLGFLVDELTPAADGVWMGRATLAGRQYGSFRLVPMASD
jgi:hypothetical protein